MGSGGMASPPGVTLPPGSNPGTMAMTTTQTQVPNDGLSLNTRGVNVWGKKSQGPTPVEAPPPVAPAPVPSPPRSSFGTSHTGYVASSSSNPYGGSSAYGAFSSPAPAALPQKTPEQLEKERMAAALFGGMVPGAAPPPTPPPPTVPVMPRSVPVAAPPVSAPPVAAPAPAPEIDLLDMGAFDVAPTPATAAPTLDIFSSLPNLVDTGSTVAVDSTLQPPLGPPPVVETVSDDEVDVPQPPLPSAPPPAPASAPIPELVDPFAAEGLLTDVLDAPLKAFNISTSKFEFNGNVMAPMKIVTAQFGQKWGSCPATSPVSITSSKVVTLDQFMKKCEEAGLHPVEAIGATNEGICAGMVNAGTMIILVHGKVTPLGGQSKLDVTVKSTDATLSGSLALYLQNMMQ